MMKLMCKTVCATAMFTASASVMAVESIDLSVIGQIVPGSCAPSFTNGGEVDYGDIGTNTLSDLEYTKLPSRVIDFSINCDGPTKVAFQQVAGRSGSVVPAQGHVEDRYGFTVAPVDFLGGYIGGSRVTGIGLDAGGNKIGGMGMNIYHDATAIDGSTNITFLRSEDDGLNFAINHQGFLLHPMFFYSWGRASAVNPLDPIAFTTLSSRMNVQAYINKRSELDLSQEINLDGLVTFELRYL